MYYIGVWCESELLGIVMSRDIGEKYEPFAMYTIEELKDYEEFLNFNGIGTERDKDNNIIAFKSLHTGEVNTPSSENSYTELNAPEVIMLFKQYK